MTGADSGLPELASLKLTFIDHARVRMQQRGISKQTVRFIVRNASRKVHKGQGRVAFTVSRRHARTLKRKGLVNAAMADKVCGKAIVAVIGQQAIEVVTVLHYYNRPGRGYFH